MTSAQPSPDGHTLRRGLRPLALFAVMFALVSGGPYGIEEMVPTAGPGLAVWTLVAMAILWGLPNALIVGELVSAIPQEGGAYQWYRTVLPPFWAFQFAVLDWLTWVLDAALYPPLLAAYLVRLLLPGSSHLVSWLLGLIVIWGVVWANIRGIQLAGRLSMFLSVLVLVPLPIMVVLGGPGISFSDLSPLVPEGTSHGTALGYALIFGMWIYSGYGGAAYAAEEIVDAERSYPRVLALLLPFTVLIYVLPLLVALHATPDWSAWETGHFTQVALVLGGTWLALLTSLGAQAGLLGIFNGELLITSRLPYAMARDGLLPRFFEQLHPRHGTPSRFLVIQGGLYSVLTYFLDFVEILVVSTWVAIPPYLLTFVTPIILRVRRPDLRGPFRVPGGLPVLLLIAAPPTAISLYVLVMVSGEDILKGLFFVALAPALYLWAGWSRRRKAAKP